MKRRIGEPAKMQGIEQTENRQKNIIANKMQKYIREGTIQMRETQSVL